MPDPPIKTYLALGDSMSIDDYTGVVGGGTARQFLQLFGDDWELVDQTYDGCQMSGVPRDRRGDVVTLTIGGNDLLWNKERYLSEGLDAFAAEHARLLADIRAANPRAVLMVGDVYAPAASMTDLETQALAVANAAIAANCATFDARLAPIYDAFLGNEQTHLCLDIEPTLEGAKTIASLFQTALQNATGSE